MTALQVTPRAVVWRYRSAQEFLEVWQAALGGLQLAFARLDASGREGLARDLVALVQRFNASGDATVKVPSAYVEVVITRR
jgi:hypothetical protein